MQIANNSLFYLKNANGQYVVAADQGRYNWPQLGSKNSAVKLKLVRQQSGNKESWKIVSTESSLDKKNVLGAFTDSRDCYYWTDGYDKDKQGWELIKSGGGTVSFNEQVSIRNVSYQQCLVEDSRNPGYITTDRSNQGKWSLEPVQSAVQGVAASIGESGASDNLEAERVFPLSVASGDPTESSVILWTCVNDNEGELTYELSKTADFQDTVKTGTIPSSEFGTDRDHTVNVDVTDLEANSVYFYRFKHNGVNSKTGRCRTLPSPTADIADVADGNGLRLGVVTCNDYSTGYFNAFYKLADADVHFVVHLGDFAYEYSQYPDGYGKRHRSEIPFEPNKFTIKRDNKEFEGCDRAYTLKDFRKVYRTYREDKALQAAMERHTWMITLDDHEVADDLYWDYYLDCPGANPDHPIYKTLDYDFEEDQISTDERKKLSKEEREELEKKEDAVRKAMSELYRNGKKAWREYVPYRKAVWADALPEDHPHHYQLYRQFKFGKLADFFLTDSRSYRDRPERKVNEEIQEVLHDALEDDSQADFNEILADERRKRDIQEWQMSMLGPAQKGWLLNGITSSDSKWKVWGNQTLMASAWQNLAKGMYDDWLGFITERYEILYAIKENERAKDGDESSHFVVLTGDMHTSLIAYLKTDFEGTMNAFNQDYTRLAGVEFMTPAVTSPGLSEGVAAAVGSNASAVPGLTTATSGVSSLVKGAASLWTGLGGSQVDNPLEDMGLTGTAMRAANPHIKHVDSEVNGYAITTFTADEMKWDVYSVDKSAYEEVDGNKVSTKGVEAKQVVAATYDPSTINLAVED